MADTIRAADGGYLFNSKQFEYNKDSLGRPVLNLKAAKLLLAVVAILEQMVVCL